MAKNIMLQGTSSHVGKSILTTALCRIFFQDGLKVVPFKAQNMALNSFVTKAGDEMGRAQVVQAEAAGLEPLVEMNPVLLKPTGNSCSQVVLMGRPIDTMSAQAYHNGYSLKALTVIEECLQKLKSDFDVIVIEGAGSPAEVNLKDNDIVNMRIAKLAPAPVLLVADIDRGGALASVVGTLELLEPDERELVKGIVINKFRGDIELLQPALDFLENRTGKPVIGVVPYLDNLGIEDEDSVSLDDKVIDVNKDIEIAVLRLPRIANFTDFTALAAEADVSVRYVCQGEIIGNPDLIIIPGSKNTIEDLLYLRQFGYDTEIIDLVNQGTPLIGICGGYQMLGKQIHDPEHSESSFAQVDGLGLLAAVTVFENDKITHQVSVHCEGQDFLKMNYTGSKLSGYEIHMGRTDFLSPVNSAFTIDTRSERKAGFADGAVRADGLVMGTYIHGIFDNDEYRRAIIDALRRRKGLKPLENIRSIKACKEASFNRLAAVVRKSLDMNLIYRIMDVK